MNEHEYRADPQSGAGNCVCGATESHRRHPHDFRRAAARYAGKDVCVCGLPPEFSLHLSGLAHA